MLSRIRRPVAIVMGVWFLVVSCTADIVTNARVAPPSDEMRARLISNVDAEQVGSAHNQELRAAFQRMLSELRSGSQETSASGRIDELVRMTKAAGSISLPGRPETLIAPSHQRANVESRLSADGRRTLARLEALGDPEVTKGRTRVFADSMAVIRQSIVEGSLPAEEKAIFQFAVVLMDSSFAYWKTELPKWVVTQSEAFDSTDVVVNGDELEVAADEVEEFCLEYPELCNCEGPLSFEMASDGKGIAVGGDDLGECNCGDEPMYARGPGAADSVSIAADEEECIVWVPYAIIVAAADVLGGIGGIWDAVQSC